MSEPQPPYCFFCFSLFFFLYLFCPILVCLHFFLIYIRIYIPVCILKERERVWIGVNGEVGEEVGRGETVNILYEKNLLLI